MPPPQDAASAAAGAVDPASLFGSTMTVRSGTRLPARRARALSRPPVTRAVARVDTHVFTRADHPLARSARVTTPITKPPLPLCALTRQGFIVRRMAVLIRKIIFALIATRHFLSKKVLFYISFLFLLVH